MLVGNLATIWHFYDFASSARDSGGGANTLRFSSGVAAVPASTPHHSSAIHTTTALAPPPHRETQRSAKRLAKLPCIPQSRPGQTGPVPTPSLSRSRRGLLPRRTTTTLWSIVAPTPAERGFDSVNLKNTRGHSGDARATLVCGRAALLAHVVYQFMFGLSILRRHAWDFPRSSGQQGTRMKLGQVVLTNQVTTNTSGKSHVHNTVVSPHA